MAEDFKVEQDQYDKINRLTGELRELSGQVRQTNSHIAQLVSLLKQTLLSLFVIILILIGAVIYGALGEKGFNSVTERLPGRPVSRAGAPGGGRYG